MINSRYIHFHIISLYDRRFTQLIAVEFTTRNRNPFILFMNEKFIHTKCGLELYRKQVIDSMPRKNRHITSIQNIFISTKTAKSSSMLAVLNTHSNILLLAKPAHWALSAIICMKYRITTFWIVGTCFSDFLPFTRFELCANDFFCA